MNMKFVLPPSLSTVQQLCLSLFSCKGLSTPPWVLLEAPHRPRVRSALASVRRLPGRWRHGGLGALRFERNQLQQRRVLHADRHGGSLLIRDAAGYGSPEEALRQPRIDLRAPARRPRLVLLRRRDRRRRRPRGPCPPVRPRRAEPVLRGRVRGERERSEARIGGGVRREFFLGCSSFFFFLGKRKKLERCTPVRKPHTSTSDLLTWSETPPPHDSVAPGSASSLSNSRSHQEFSPDGRFIVSADRDYKIRVTVVPKNPLDGAHEIQTFCLGHSEYVSCLDFIRSPDYPHGLLVSGSGDSTVRLWDVTLGSLLDTCEIGAKAELSATDGIEEEPCHAVTDLCTCPNGTSIALAVQSLKGVMLLNCDLSAKTLSIAKERP
ncbi:uncharacterized protein LOC130136641 [Syzygium oleosum]|uniref:uncharacterized protein LOC130136641 n=1 Tax=Syzygium oleosum TaxID=219896 RepID=UPI0024BA3DE8|nr:uncharacterized protein LOC130136641 [Syzygium oleosum]